jgi:hypothetical protein
MSLLRDYKTKYIFHVLFSRDVTVLEVSSLKRQKYDFFFSLALKEPTVAANIILMSLPLSFRAEFVCAFVVHFTAATLRHFIGPTTHPLVPIFVDSLHLHNNDPFVKDSHKAK